MPTVSISAAGTMTKPMMRGRRGAASRADSIPAGAGPGAGGGREGPTRGTGGRTCRARAAWSRLEPLAEAPCSRCMVSSSLRVPMASAYRKGPPGRAGIQAEDGADVAVAGAAQDALPRQRMASFTICRATRSAISSGAIRLRCGRREELVDARVHLLLALAVGVEAELVLPAQAPPPPLLQGLRMDIRSPKAAWRIFPPWRPRRCPPRRAA